jgi:hypothetical protein
MIHSDLSSPNTTYPISAATQIMCNFEHVGTADIPRGALPDGTLSVHVDCRRGPMHASFVRYIPIRHLFI